MTAVSVFMDVEDPINPLADDAALDLAWLVWAVGVRGSFCVTGEKCRKLDVRGRSDVRDVLKLHCLGLHTDTHSEHPTTMELLEDLSFEDGCGRVLNTENRGHQAFVEVFERSPAFWGGAGNTWSPEVTDTLKRLGIPAYAYALTSFPGEPVHRFNGVMALPQHLSVSESSWGDDAKSEAESERVLAALRSATRPWTGVFVGHPTRFRYAEFWDKVYMSGKTPVRLEFAELAQDDVYKRAKDNLAKFLSKLRDEFEVVGVDDALGRPWRFRPPTDGETAHFRSATEAAIRAVANWPVHRPGLDPSNIVNKTMALDSTLVIAE